tara:strand:+ start:249 stop:500 length:252 start_codon:yes stop_codon:yes gene_type:complete
MKIFITLFLILLFSGTSHAIDCDNLTGTQKILYKATCDSNKKTKSKSSNEMLSKTKDTTKKILGKLNTDSTLTDYLKKVWKKN